MPHWLPAEPGSGHGIPPTMGPGSGPTQGVLPQRPEREGMGFGPRAAGRVGRRRQEGQPLPSAHTFLSRPAPQLATLCHDAAQHGPPGCCTSTFWQCCHQDPFCPLCIKRNASPVSCPMVQPSQPDPQAQSPKPPRCGVNTSIASMA